MQWSPGHCAKTLIKTNSNQMHTTQHPNGDYHSREMAEWENESSGLGRIFFIAVLNCDKSKNRSRTHFRRHWPQPEWTADTCEADIDGYIKCFEGVHTSTPNIGKSGELTTFIETGCINYNCKIDIPTATDDDDTRHLASDRLNRECGGIKTTATMMTTEKE